MRVHVTTRTSLFEERKRQHIERGYRIEDERPVPVNGLCSFVAVWESAPSADPAEPGENGTPICAIEECMSIQEALWRVCCFCC